MGKKVLLIDDDENAVKFMQVVLAENGYETDCAHDGKAGLEKIEATQPDLVVLDVMMPKKSGFTLFKQLARDERHKDIPVLMCSGVAGVLEELDEASGDTHQRPYDSLREAMRKNIAQMREEGLIRPDMFMDKPLDPDKFIAKVKELLGE